MFSFSRHSTVSLIPWLPLKHAVNTPVGINLNEIIIFVITWTRSHSYWLYNPLEGNWPTYRPHLMLSSSWLTPRHLRVGGERRYTFLAGTEKHSFHRDPRKLLRSQSYGIWCTYVIISLSIIWGYYPMLWYPYFPSLLILLCPRRRDADNGALCPSAAHHIHN